MMTQSTLDQAYRIFMFIFLIQLINARFISTRCKLLQGFYSVCPDGQIWDSTVCSCTPMELNAPSQDCKSLNCPLRFNSPRCMEFKRDTNRCTTCECECTELDQICPVNCPSGTEVITTTSGCRKCRCKADRCPDVSKLCPNVRCPNGRVQDVNGCRTCKCKPVRRRVKCPVVMCDESCPYGTIADANNCPTCYCKSKPRCSILSCDNFCPGDRMQDFNGCDMCQCKPIGGLR